MMKGTENRKTAALLIILGDKGTAERAREATTTDESKRAEEKKETGTQKK